LVLASAFQLPAQQPSLTYRYTGHISFDIAKVPFSRFGSYMAFSDYTNASTPHGLREVYLRNMRGGQHRVFRLELLAKGSPIPFEIDASPTVLHLRAEAGSMDICIAKDDQIRLRGEGVSLRLIAESNTLAVPYGNSHWEMNTFPHEKYMIWPISGSLLVSTAPSNGTSNGLVEATFAPNGNSRQIEAEIDTYKSVWTPHQPTTDFDASVNAVAREYATWLQRMPEVSPEFGSGAELAAYVNWASFVEASGFFMHPAMLMSKNWMEYLWSWDHGFNAMALVYKAPELAWQQYELPFDNQDIHGALPDSTIDSGTQFNFSKPPVHGWMLGRMIANGGYSDLKHLGIAYGQLTRWTDWYFKYRDSNGDGLPEYNSGNDSGWDNSTIMLSGVPVESPDLDSFLILQMDTLASLARKLGKEQEARTWQMRSDRLLEAMLAQLWKGDHFVALRVQDGTEIESDSLILYLPLVLGKRLPAQVRNALIAGLTKPGRFRTSHGLSTEALTSKFYAPDGYWRGPIWAPSTMILVEGLDSAGEHGLAANLRVDFCKMAQQSGMSENFDAISGKGRGDPAYTWTSSIYLIFAHQLWEEQHGGKH
jgi:glycogen debranching enzyme